MSRPPVISTKGQLKEKLEMVESLADIEIATTLIKALGQDHDENPIDRNYKSLGCGISLVEHSSKLFGVISAYLKNTHGVTHSEYTLELLNVFEVGLL